MKNVTKILCIIVSTALLFSIQVSLPVFASTYQTSSSSQLSNTSDALDFVVEEGVLKKYNGTASEVIIPDDLGIIKIAGWSDLGAGAFSDNKTITSVVIPEGVTEIGDFAFTFCENLASVFIPDSITYIGMYAFENCNITSLRLPDKPIRFGERCFSGCNAPINIPEGSYFSVRSFAGCSGITSVTISAGESIPLGGFENCMNLKTVIIKEGVKGIGITAFRNCTSLTTVTIPNTITNIGNSAFEGCSSLTSLSIPDSVEFIAYNAFNFGIPILSESAEKLYYVPKNYTSYTIPSSVKVICAEAFENCSSINQIVIPDGITTIGDRAFMNCSSLASVEIPDSVTNIGSEAFFNCSSLNSISIPDSVTTISGTAFERTAITQPIIYNHDKILCFVPRDFTSYIIPETVTKIGDGAFANCKELTKILIPDNVKDIGSSAFSGCFDLAEVSLPQGITKISDSCFYYCGLNSIVIPDTVTAIEDNAFNSSHLESVSIPSSVTSIGTMAFVYCRELNSLTVPGSVETIGYRAFQYCSGITSLNLEYGIKEIGDAAFFECKGLTAITIPDSVTSIGSAAFLNCVNLESVTISDWTDTIGESAFQYCLKLDSVKIGNRVTNIGRYAFDTCSNLTEVTIPGSVTTIGEMAFARCNEALTIYGLEDSAAQSYALSENIPFVAVILPTPSGTATPTSTPSETPAPSATATPTMPLIFSDIDNVEWARDAIYTLANSGIINGYGDGTFRPDINITRAEFTKMLVMTFDIYNPEATSTFADLPEGTWYIPYVGSAETAGLAKGNGDGIFNPESSITREEMFTFCARAINKFKSVELLSTGSSEVASELNKFVDGGEVSDWAKEYVASITKCGLVTGSPFGTGYALNPQNPITRAEVAVVLDKAMKLTNVTPTHPLLPSPEATITPTSLCTTTPAPTATPAPTTTPAPTATQEGPNNVDAYELVIDTLFSSYYETIGIKYLDIKLSQLSDFTIEDKAELLMKLQKHGLIILELGYSELDRQGYIENYNFTEGIMISLRENTIINNTISLHAGIFKGGLSGIEYIVDVEYKDNEWEITRFEVYAIA